MELPKGVIVLDDASLDDLKYAIEELVDAWPEVNRIHRINSSWKLMPSGSAAKMQWMRPVGTDWRYLMMTWNKVTREATLEVDAL